MELALLLYDQLVESISLIGSITTGTYLLWIYLCIWIFGWFTGQCVGFPVTQSVYPFVSLSSACSSQVGSVICVCYVSFITFIWSIKFLHPFLSSQRFLVIYWLVGGFIFLCLWLRLVSSKGPSMYARLHLPFMCPGPLSSSHCLLTHPLSHLFDGPMISRWEIVSQLSLLSTTTHGAAQIFYSAIISHRTKVGDTERFPSNLIRGH